MTDANAEPGEPRAARLKQAVRQARIDMAERTGVVVDLHDAEVARLEILNEALDPLFNDIPAEVELFERGITRGDPPRLWIDMIAHVMARAEVRELMQDIGVVASDEKLDFESRVNLIVSELRLPPVTLLGPVPAKSPATT